jgi:carbonic anhydrase
MPTTDSRIPALLAKNAEWAKNPTYKSPIKFLEMQKIGRAMEGGTVIVVACCDPRVTPEEFFGMSGGPKATVIRTGGGRVAPAMETLCVLTALVNEGKAGALIIVHHTDCGLSHITDEDIKESLKKRASLGEEEEKKVERMVFWSFGNPEDSVKADVAAVKASPFFKGMQIVGMVQDTETGLLRVVESGE